MTWKLYRLPLWVPLCISKIRIQITYMWQKFIVWPLADISWRLHSLKALFWPKMDHNLRQELCRQTWTPNLHQSSLEVEWRIMYQRSLSNNLLLSSHLSMLLARRVSAFILNFLGADVKISTENERLLKRIVEITFRNKPKKSIGRHPA